MAYSGILVRGDIFNTIYLDPPIAREIVMAGEHLGVGTNTSTVHWLNPQVLSKIGEITDDVGSTDTGFKTSNLPITYDGAGYIQEDIDWMLIDGTYKFRYEALAALEVLSNSSFKFGDMDIDVGVLDLITTTTVEITTLTSTGAACTFTKGIKAIVYNENTKTELGVISTSGGSITFAAQTSGQTISVRTIDSNYNNSAKTIGVIP